MKRPKLTDYNKNGSMLAPFGHSDYIAYSLAQEEYIDYLENNIKENTQSKKSSIPIASSDIIGRKLKYNGTKYIVIEYFNSTDLIMLNNENTISRIHAGIEWLD